MSPPTADPEALAARLRPGRAAPRREPADRGHFDIRIARDGTWYYRGTPITRKPLVTLFSTVLERDATGQYWLSTPVERGRIDVDDAPFAAVEMTATGTGADQMLAFRTNVDDWVTAGAGHPIRVATDAATGEPAPYIAVRNGLEALITRAVYYDLVELGVDGAGANAHLFGVWSGGVFFALGDAVADDA